MRRLEILAGLCLVLTLRATASGTIIYVDDDANAPGDGKSWATAYRYLQDALADAKTADKPMEIRIGQGIYKANQRTAQAGGSTWFNWFKLTSGVALMGGYAGVSASGRADPNMRDTALYETILSVDLAGNDVEVNEARDLEKEPTRADNTAVLQIYQAELHLCQEPRLHRRSHKRRTRWNHNEQLSIYR